MATVYLAQDLKHDRRVALKVLHPELAATLGPERFLREIRLTARLDHPHILPVFESGESAGFLWYTMPYVEGESLRDRLRREVQLPIEDAVRIARGVAEALDYAHRHGIVHRDIKPENVLLGEGHARVADFGVAQALGAAGAGRLTGTGLAVGTPAYMSPEQATAGPVDGRSDVYTLGCVLYEMLVGEPPFAARTAQASIARRLSEPVPQIRHLREAVPARLEQAVMTALARVPADRFPSAIAFHNALADSREFSDRSEGPVAHVGWRITRRRTVLATAVVAAVALVGVAIALPRVQRLRGGAPPVAAAAVPGVAVLPFRTTGADPELWHEGIVDLLSYNLEGIGQLRKIDPVTVLTGWRQMGGSASHALTADEARQVGRHLGSRYVVTGRAVQMGANVQLIAEVQDVESGKMRGAVRVTRPADSASSLVDGLTLELLRGNLLPTDGAYRPPSLSRATTTSLPALKAYLAGEREYRTAKWSDAVRHYQRAVEADSNFASAWVRLSSACGWWGGCPTELGEGSSRRVLRLADQLPDREARRIRAIKMLDIEALEKLTAMYPDDIEAWVGLGDAYYHIGGVVLRSAEAYRGAFNRSVRLYPYYGEGYVHLIEDAFLRLDSLDAQRLIDGNVALGAAQSCTDQVSYDLVWGTAAARARAMAVLDTVAPIWCVVQSPLAAPPHVLDRLAQIYGAMADTATQANDRTFALWRLLQLRVPSGQITAARRALARLAGAPVTGISAARWEIMLHLSGFPDSVVARRASRVIATGAGPTDNFWIGALAIEEGRWNDLEVVQQALGRQAPGFDTATSPSIHHVRTYSGAYAAALGAYAKLVRGDYSHLAKFESALARLPALLPIAPTLLDHEQPQQYLRYRVGKLLFDDGRMQDAQRYFRSFNAYDYFYTSQAELYLGRIAEASGRPEEAVAHYGRFVRWWRYADEPLRPLWEEARQALSRLAGE
jgi:serine/threonine-protein kinase